MECFFRWDFPSVSLDLDEGSLFQHFFFGLFIQKGDW